MIDVRGIGLRQDGDPSVCVQINGEDMADRSCLTLGDARCNCVVPNYSKLVSGEMTSKRMSQGSPGLGGLEGSMQGHVGHMN
eukprot:4440327-Amphidinium_carterae.1